MTDRLGRYAVVAIVVVTLLGIVITEYPAVAALVVVGVPVVAWWRWRRRQRARQRQARMRLRQAQRLGDLLTVSGAEFEAIVADLFTALGYTDVERIGGSGDLGVDLLATNPAGETVVIQCKRYGRGNRVGSPAVQSLMGTVVNRGADRGIFVTTSDFTAPAVALAKSTRVPITLIDGGQITRLAVEAASEAEASPDTDG